MLTTWLDGLKHVEAVEADPRVCYDSCCFQKMVLRKHWSIAIPRNPNIIPQNQKIKRHQKTSKDIKRQKQCCHDRQRCADPWVTSGPLPGTVLWLLWTWLDSMACHGKICQMVTVVTMVTVTIWDACDPMGRGIWTTLPNPFWCLRFEMDRCGPWRHRFESGIEPVEQLICDVMWCWHMCSLNCAFNFDEVGVIFY